jgi:hypothetical protein
VDCWMSVKTNVTVPLGSRSLAMLRVPDVRATRVRSLLAYMLACLNSSGFLGARPRLAPLHWTGLEMASIHSVSTCAKEEL